MTLTNAALLEKVYQKHNLTKAEATEAVEAFLRIAKNCLRDGEDLLISGFGKSPDAAAISRPVRR